jgi:hypothetical protein
MEDMPEGCSPPVAIAPVRIRINTDTEINENEKSGRLSVTEKESRQPSRVTL